MGIVEFHFIEYISLSFSIKRAFCETSLIAVFTQLKHDTTSIDFIAVEFGINSSR